MQKCGYLYIAVRSQYINEVITSAMSLKNFDKDAHITLITNEEIKHDVFDDVIICVGNVTNRIEMFSYRLKYIYSASPYNKTFYVDTDTYFYDNCREVFNILDYFDICMVAAPRDRHSPFVNGEPLTGYVPRNCGVIVYRKNPENESLFKKWQEIYEKKLKTKDLLPFEWDQTAFMEALLNSRARLYTLPNIYNAVSVFPISVNGLVKIIHQRSNDYEKLRKKINITPALRCWDPVGQRCIYEKPSRSIFKR